MRYAGMGNRQFSRSRHIKETAPGGACSDFGPRARTSSRRPKLGATHAPDVPRPRSPVTRPRSRLSLVCFHNQRCSRPLACCAPWWRPPRNVEAPPRGPPAPPRPPAAHTSSLQHQQTLSSAAGAGAAAPSRAAAAARGGAAAVGLCAQRMQRRASTARRHAATTLLILALCLLPGELAAAGALKAAGPRQPSGPEPRLAAPPAAAIAIQQFKPTAVCEHTAPPPPRPRHRRQGATAVHRQHDRHQVKQVHVYSRIDAAGTEAANRAPANTLRARWRSGRRRARPGA